MSGDIYRPAEDTYLLLEVLKEYRPCSVLEIGVGAGYISRRLVEEGFNLVAADLDYNALRESGLDSRIDLVCCDGAEALRNELFDIVFFNPPYLPSEGLEDKTVDGGEGGVDIAYRIFQNAVHTLRSSGMIIFLLSSLSDKSRFFERIKRLKFTVKLLKKKRLFFEELSVYEARRNVSL